MEFSDQTIEQLRFCRIPENHWEDSVEKIQNTSVDLTNWLHNIKDKIGGRGLYIYGEYGRGKSGLAAIIARRALAYGIFSLWLEGNQMANHVIKDTMFDSDETLIERAESVQLLVINEFNPNIAKNSDFSVRIIDDLIRHRVSKGRTTILTSNVSPAKLKTEYSGLCGSLINISKEAFSPVWVTGEDLREKSAK